MLVAKEWKGVSIEDLARAQLSGFSDLMGNRIMFDGPHLRLLPAAAQAIGMALHELATNASKYGSLSTPSGRIVLTWNMSNDQADEFSMTWMESGGPEVAAPSRNGFGQKVIIDMAQASLNGKATIEYHPTGVVWTLQSPAASTLV